MKHISLSIVSILILSLASCKKEFSYETQRSQTTAEKISGKWMLVQRTEEDFSSSGTLISKYVEIGTPGDSLIFAGNNKLYTYSDINGSFTLNYKVQNSTTLTVESETWNIVLLTLSELKLVSEEMDPSTGEKSVVNVTMKLP